MRLVIIKSDNKNNYLILVFYDERSIINQCHYMVDKYFRIGVDTMDKAKEALWTRSFVLDTLINFLVFLIYYFINCYYCRSGKR